MKKTKVRILEIARTLFNERGFLNVTIRQIAEELGMSSGNLNYHYRKREDILEALYFEMVEHFDARVAALPQQEISFEQIRTDIYSSMQLMLDYRFFWTDLYQLLQLRETIHSHFQEALNRRIKGYQFLFQALQGKGLMLPPNFAEEHELLGSQMIHFGNTWLYAAILYPNNKIDENYAKRQTDVLIMMLHPYLTARGQKALKSVLNLK